ncbi:MAG: glutathione S-transferase [Gammaproteobacteria bacterium]|jgi:glutathione S-transferase
MVKLFEKDIKTREILEWKGLHLLHFAGSSCSQKTRISLNLKGINWESHPVDLVAQDNFKPWFLGINPRGLVPVLVHDGDVHIESNDILEYLDQAFPQKPLIPSELHDRIVQDLREEDNLHIHIRNLTMRFVIPKILAMKKPESLSNFTEASGQIEGSEDSHKAMELKYWQAFAERGITDEQVIISANKFKSALSEFDEQLASNTYLLGEQLTQLDIAWFIYAARLQAAGYPIERLHPNVHRWFSELVSRDEFAREVAIPLPLKLVSGGLSLIHRLRGTTLEKITGL